MNDQQIYALMLKKPAIRAVQIADSLNVDLKEASDALRDLVEAGNVVQTKGTAPNGQQAMVYDLSESFKTSREYGALVALDALDTAKSAPAATPVFKELLAPLAVAPKPPELTGSKVDRAIAFITRFGAASCSELRDAMGLAAKDSVSPYLTSALKAGRVHRDGEAWKLGPAPAPKAEPAPAARATPPAIVPVPAQAGIAAPAPKSEPTILCGVWSSGSIEIRKSGDRVLLTRSEYEYLIEFVAQRVAA